MAKDDQEYLEEEDYLDADQEADQDQELYEHYRLTADKGQALLRIDKFLVDRLPNTSRNKIQNAATAGCILVNEKPVKSNYKVKPGDVISLVLSHPPRELELIPENIPIDIVYEDGHLIILNKQAGMVVHPGYGNYTGTLVNALIHHFSQLPVKEVKSSVQNEDPFEGSRPGLVHRLDKDTTGLMIVAKDEFSMNHLARQFFERTTKRRYIALVWGDLLEDEGTITGNLGRSPKNRKMMQVFPEGDQGKHAVTHYKVLERFRYVTFVQCRLETGRTHQIRAHFKHLGHPLFNDELYGGNKILKGTTFTKYKQFVENCFNILPRQALHARSLGFIHPHTKEEMYFESEIPEDIQQVLEKWRRYTSANQD